MKNVQLNGAVLWIHESVEGCGKLIGRNGYNIKNINQILSDPEEDCRISIKLLNFLEGTFGDNPDHIIEGLQHMMKK